MISKGGNHPQNSRFLFIGPTVKYRPKLSFSSKKVTNIEILLGIWLKKVGNGYLTYTPSRPYTVRMFYKIVINENFQGSNHFFADFHSTVKYRPK